MPDLLGQIDRFEAAAEQLREVIREAHSATKALRLAEREARRAEADVVRLIETTVADLINTAARQALAELQESVEITKANLDAKFNERYDRLTNLLLYGNEQGNGETIVHEAVRKRGPNLGAT